MSQDQSSNVKLLAKMPEFVLFLIAMACSIPFVIVKLAELFHAIDEEWMRRGKH